MAHKTFLTIIVLAILCCGGCTKNGDPILPIFYPTIEWEKTFSTSYYSEGNVVRPTHDGCFVIGGYRQYIVNNSSASLTKIDENGNVIWDKLIVINGSTSIYDLQQTLDKGFILCGNARNSLNTGTNIWFAKTDASGNVIWSSVIPNYGSSLGTKVQCTSDGNFIIGGVSSYINGQPHGIIAKVNTNGTVLWSFDVCGFGYNAGEVRSIQPLPDGGTLIIGNENSSFMRAMGIYIVKVNSEGSSEWGKIIVNDTASLSCRSGIRVEDGNYVIAGYRYPFNQHPSNSLILKIDSLGRILMQNTMKDTLFGVLQDVYPTADNGFILVGSKQAISRSNYNSWIIKTDNFFNCEWSRFLGGEKDDILVSVIANRDGSIISAGTTSSYSSGKADEWIVKFHMSSCDQPVARRK